MSETPRIFISHTTRDRRDFALAHRIAEALRGRAARVWIAPDDIPAGAAWEPEIVKGILDQCTHFLVILSASAVASEWVVKEIELARARRENDPSFVILQLPVAELPAFPQRDFLSALQAVAYTDRFEEQLTKIAAAIGLRPEVPGAFEPLIKEKTSEFVGREFVFRAFEKFLVTRPSGYFLLLADPGAGKTAVLAEYERRQSPIAYFNVRSLGFTTAQQFISNVSAPNEASKRVWQY